MGGVEGEAGKLWQQKRATNSGTDSGCASPVMMVIFMLSVCASVSVLSVFFPFFPSLPQMAHTHTVHYREEARHVECWDGVSKHNLQVRTTNQLHQATAGQRAACVE